MSCVGVGAAWNIADEHFGSTVAVFGLGTVGLSVPIVVLLINAYFWWLELRW